VRESDASSSFAAVPEATLPRGTAIGRFIVLGLVGRGAMGEVYGAYDPELDRKIAIKVVRARFGADSDGSEGRLRLMREAQAAAKISHPNVVVVYDAGVFGDRIFIAMEFVEGHTLRYWLQERARAWQEILEAFVAAGRGLAAAHAKELVHRDFKPDNVMVGGGGQVRVMDFGLARIVDANAPLEEPGRDANPLRTSDVSAPPVDLDATPAFGGAPGAGSPASPVLRDKLTATGALLGTPAYMSPEQFLGRPADARSDQFSFCVALYEALFGARPFAGRTLEELSQNVTRGALLEPPPGARVPPRVRKALERGLRLRPVERFENMQALLAEIEPGVSAGRGSFAAHAAAKLAGIWEAPIGGQPVVTPEKEVMRAAFLATEKPYAPAAFAAASATLDRYAQRWSELYVDVCEATHVRGEQSAEVLDLRMAYLMEALADLKALCLLFREATADVVVNADNAASSLDNLDRCLDAAFIRNVVRPPEDFKARNAVDALRARLVDVRAVYRVGRMADGLGTVRPLVDDARQVGYGPIFAEALLMRGTLELQMFAVPQSIETLEEAYSEAQVCRHDEVAAEAAIIMIGAEAYQRSRLESAEIWARNAEALLRRLGSQDRLWGWFFQSRALLREVQGRFNESVEDQRRAVEFNTRIYGPTSVDVGMSTNNLANQLAISGDFEGALAVVDQALAILAATASLEHPWALVATANRAQFLFRRGRFSEAIETASVAFERYERVSEPRSLAATIPLRTLGLSRLALGQFAAAREVLERAVSIRDAIDKNPLRLAEVHFALARALYETGEPLRALALARQARTEYAQAARTPIAERDLADLDSWLEERDQAARAPRSKRGGTRPRPPARSPRPRRKSSSKR
jgi:tetratricopeptide (TPR) repeat protein